MQTTQLAQAAQTRPRARRINWLPYLLIAPLFVSLIVFIFRPVLQSLYLSLLEWRLGSGVPKWIGFGNYQTLFAEPVFWNALKNSLLYTIVIGSLSLAIGLGLALALRHVIRLREAWQAIFFLPVAATMSAMAIVWRFILNPSVGILNNTLVALGLPTQDWLSSDFWSHVAIIWVGIWSSAGYAMVLFSAGLTAISKELHEAAAIDGASPIQQFQNITLPLLAPTMLFTVVIITLRSMENFDTIKILTDGGPLQATQTLSHLLFQEGFQFFNAGYASSIAVVYFFILIFIALFQLRSDKETH
jgi:multiple sugar transport system permease protein